MPLNTQLSNLAVNAEANALADLLDDGYIDIMSGTQPATCDTPISVQTLLVVLELSPNAFGNAVNGVINANTIAPGVALLNGTASWFRAYQSDHLTAVMDGSIGVIIGEANMVLSSTAITAGVAVTVSSLQHTVAKSTVGS